MVVVVVVMPVVVMPVRLLGLHTLPALLLHIPEGPSQNDNPSPSARSTSAAS